MQWVRLLLLFLLMLLAEFSVASSPTLLNRAYWVDTSDAAEFQQAINANYTAYSNTLYKGYLGHPVWVRVEISGSSENQPLVLRIRPSFLSSITLYDLADERNDQIIPQQSGRSIPLDSTSFETIDLGFVIPASTVPRYVYLRINTPTSIIANIQILPIKQASLEAKNQALIMILYVGALLVAAIWGLVNFFISRRSLYGLFALRQIFSTAHIILIVGLYRYIMSDNFSSEFNNWIYNFILVIAILPIILFDARLLKEFNVRRLYRNIPLAFSCLTFIGLALLFSGHTTTALQLSSAITLIASLSLLLPAFMAKAKPNEPYSGLALWLLRGGFVLTTLIILAPLLILLGMDLGSVNNNLITTHAGISTIQLVLLLYINSKQREFTQQQLLIDGQVAKSMLAQETKQRIEKESYLAMVTHELRNPLSVIKLLAASEKHSNSIQRATSDMQNIIDRVAESERISDNPLKVHLSRIDCNQLISELLARQKQGERIKITAPTSLSFTSDHHLLFSILGNLLDNAMKYSAVNSPVELKISHTTRQELNGFNFCIHNIIGDAGLPDESQLFKKYYRSPGAHRQIGSGLGLYLVSQWAKALGGAITEHHFSNHQHQSCIEFTLWIPQ